MPAERPKPVTELLAELIGRRSITPDDAGCQALIETRLESAGFNCESMNSAGVTNLWARRDNDPPVLCFAGHTDVVPPGDGSAWQSDPFDPTIRNGRMYGRGAADMKGSLAAMVVAAERFLQGYPQFAGSLAVLLTSDEEGDATDGTRIVVEALEQRGERIDWCVIGEPSSRRRIGDVIRIGRRGSLSGALRLPGVQGHVAYPDQVENPIARFAPALHELATKRWDDGDEYFPATGFQFVDLKSGAGADNVTPPALDARFNFRYSPAWTSAGLMAEVERVLAEHDIDAELSWRCQGEPFLTPGGSLIDAVCRAVEAETGMTPERSTGGGTSDGRFLRPHGAEVVELGPVNETIHQVDENVLLEDLEKLVDIYVRVAEALLTGP